MLYDIHVSRSLTRLLKNKKFPVFLEKDEDGFYIVECPLFKGCYSQGKTIDEALVNIREVIDMCLEEKDNIKRVRSYFPQEFSLHSITV